MKYAIYGIYCAFLGYQVRKHDLDVKALRKFNDGMEALMRRNAQIWSEELAAAELGADRHVGRDASRGLPTVTGNDASIRVTDALLPDEDITTPEHILHAGETVREAHARGWRIDTTP